MPLKALPNQVIMINLKRDVFLSDNIMLKAFLFIFIVDKMIIHDKLVTSLATAIN